MPNVKLISGPANVPDCVVVSVGSWRNPALLASSAEHPDIPPYRRTVLATLRLLDARNVERLQAHVSQGGKAEDCFLVARVNINGDESPRLPIEGEVLKLVSVSPAKEDGGSPALFTKGPLAGAEVLNARIVEFYPVAPVREATLAELLAEAPVGATNADTGRAPVGLRAVATNGHA